MWEESRRRMKQFVGHFTVHQPGQEADERQNLVWRFNWASRDETNSQRHLTMLMNRKVRKNFQKSNRLRVKMCQMKTGVRPGWGRRGTVIGPLSARCWAEPTPDGHEFRPRARALIPVGLPDSIPGALVLFRYGPGTSYMSSMKTTLKRWITIFFSLSF